MRGSHDTTGRRFAALAFVALTAACSSASQGASARALPLRTVRDVRFPGRTTRFDYQSVDATARRLYIAHLGDSSVVVVDLDRLRPIATIGHIADVHGVLAVPELARVFATATRTNQLIAIDTATNRIVDGLVLVSNKNAGSVTMVDAYTLTVIATVKLGAEVGNVTYDPTAHLAWAAVRTPDQLVAFDPVTRHVVARIPLPGCDGAHGVYVTSASRAFVACERNARLAVVDLTRRRLVDLTRVGADPDVLAVDPTDGRLYVAAESGTVTVLATRSAVRVLARAHLVEAAHSVAVDPATRRVAFPLEDAGGHPVLRVMEPVGA